MQNLHFGANTHSVHSLPRSSDNELMSSPEQQYHELNDDDAVELAPSSQSSNRH